MPPRADNAFPILTPHNLPKPFLMSDDMRVVKELRDPDIALCMVSFKNLAQIGAALAADIPLSQRLNYNTCEQHGSLGQIFQGNAKRLVSLYLMHVYDGVDFPGHFRDPSQLLNALPEGQGKSLLVDTLTKLHGGLAKNGFGALGFNLEHRAYTLRDHDEAKPHHDFYSWNSEMQEKRCLLPLSKVGTVVIDPRAMPAKERGYKRPEQRGQKGEWLYPTYTELPEGSVFQAPPDYALFWRKGSPLIPAEETQYLPLPHDIPAHAGRRFIAVTDFA